MSWELSWDCPHRQSTYTGDTHVTGGTLNVGSEANPLPRTFGGKYFRLTIKRSNGGSATTWTDNCNQASEFKLFNAAGVIVPITVTDVQDATNLRSWTVIVNGVSRGAKAKYRDGKIVLQGCGFAVIVR